MPDQAAQPGVLPLLALRNMVMFPGVVTGLRVGRPRSLAAVDQAVDGDGRLVLVAQRDARVNDPGPADLYDVGVIAEIRKASDGGPQGPRAVIVSGVERCRILEFVGRDPALTVRCERFPGVRDHVPSDLLHRIKRLYAAGDQEHLRLLLLEALPASADLDYVIAFQLKLPVDDKQALLAEASLLERYRMLVPVMEVEREIVETGAQIWKHTVRDVTDEDRDAYLRDRKAALEGELRELVGEGTEVEELRKRVEEADLPPEALQEAERELARLGRMGTGSPEYAVSEDYLDWLVSLPWHKSTDAVVDLQRARDVLDRDHYDRAEVKDRILEYLSVTKLNPDAEGALLCFVGAPGVGKTSMGRSIAEATGREFYRVALGGIHDEAEIRGHRRTYVGALPGAFIRAMRRVGVNNPVLMLDEIDKLAGGLRGDPAGALLEVLDAEQNVDFTDNYLALPFDLSRVMFVATANTLDTIPVVLLDRLEIIELPGYTTEEKMAIARQYLVPKQLDAAGLAGEWMEFEEDAIELLVEGYTQEAGVRSLERQIASVCRKLAKEYLAAHSVYGNVNGDRLGDLLGPPPYHKAEPERSPRPGVCTTLAVTPMGATVLTVEALSVAGKGKLLVTGRVGRVLRESVLLAFSYWQTHAESLGVPADAFTRSDFHVHFPRGEVPKEGTSAGLPVAVALASLLSGVPVSGQTGALGEITLHGLVLPVSRIAERLAAAQRAGIRRLVVPERNRPDIEAARDSVLPEGLTLAYVSTVSEATAVLLPEVAPAPTSDS